MWIPNQEGTNCVSDEETLLLALLQTALVWDRGTGTQISGSSETVWLIGKISVYKGWELVQWGPGE